MLTIAGTGHRPDKLFEAGTVDPYSVQALGRLTDCAQAYLKILTVDHSAVAVISGMALGWDMALAQAALNLNFALIASVPFEGQECRWREPDQKRYHYLLAQCDEVHYVCEPGYKPEKMQRRNEWMVDRADVMLALWNGTTGGTWNCVRYARQKDLRIVNVWNSWSKYAQR